MKYITTERQAADIFTKHFTDKIKWFAALLSINHYPNFSLDWLKAGSPVDKNEAYTRDTIPYKHEPSKKHSFQDGVIEEFDIVSEGEYADSKPGTHVSLNRNYVALPSPKRNRRLKKHNTA